MTKRLNNTLLALIATLFLASCGSGNSALNATATSGSAEGNTTDSTPGESNPADDTSNDPGIPRRDVPPIKPVVALKDQMVAQINEVRARGATCGNETFGPAQPVQWDVNVESAAALHNAYMRAEEKVSHIGYRDSTPSQRLTESGFEWQTMAENIAAGYPTVAQVVESWISSNGHCRNIMNPLFNTIGADKLDGYLTSDFINYWTLVLAQASPTS
jgi:uncharacterized protein YkwD